jgi:glycosyltransferase involved in cell wall biosynthesis
MDGLKLSVIVTTRNEAANIVASLRSFAKWRERGEVELIVVDNGSTDETKAMARECGARVFDKGPERCAQRNLGWREAKADWVLVLDADMIMPEATVEEILGPKDADAYWIPEVRTGEGLRTRARNFERSFYDGTCIDALRLFRKSVLEATGGYDETLIAGGEDWELDIRVLATGAKCKVLKHNLVHNESQLTLTALLKKKAYYTKSFAAYKAKWPGHPSVRKQFSPWYRFVGVFVEDGKWKRLLRHPVLAAAMYFERMLVGLTYLANR